MYAGSFAQSIQREVLEGRGNKCEHCSDTGATVDCSRAGCTAVFHLPCALSIQEGLADPGNVYEESLLCDIVLGLVKGHFTPWAGGELGQGGACGLGVDLSLGTWYQNVDLELLLQGLTKVLCCRYLQVHLQRSFEVVKRGLEEGQGVFDLQQGQQEAWQSAGQAWQGRCPGGQGEEEETGSQWLRQACGVESDFDSSVGLSFSSLTLPHSHNFISGL